MTEEKKTEGRHQFSQEERRKGGLRSVETRRRQKTFKESIKAILACEVPDGEKRAQLEALGVDATILNAIHTAVNEKAMRGDVDAARYLRDTAGEKPRDGLEVEVEGITLEGLDMSSLTDQQLKQIAGALAARQKSGGGNGSKG